VGAQAACRQGAKHLNAKQKIILRSKMAHPCAESSNELFKVLGNWNYILKHTSLCEKLPEKKTKRYKPKNDSPLNQATLRPYKKLKVEKAQAMGGDHDE
jgi:hypothetical protein